MALTVGTPQVIVSPPCAGNCAHPFLWASEGILLEGTTMADNFNVGKTRMASLLPPEMASFYSRQLTSSSSPEFYITAQYIKIIPSE